MSASRHHQVTDRKPESAPQDLLSSELSLVLSSLDMYAGPDPLPQTEDGRKSVLSPSDWPVRRAFPSTGAPSSTAVTLPRGEALRPGNYFVAHARVCERKAAAGGDSARGAKKN
jgi:hypothetical protein